jgi:hypothetical protein
MSPKSNKRLKQPCRRNILRQDRASTHGYTVRIRGLLIKNERVSKHFSDVKHGGARGALKAATQWRNDVLRDFGREVPD